MNIVFLLYHGFSESSGISKKIHSQIEALQQLGHRVNVCTYLINKKGERIRLMDKTVISNYGIGRWASLKKRMCYDAIYKYALIHDIDLFYIRSFHNANPFTIHLLKRLKKAGIKIVMEIPTYPYDSEYVGFPWATRIELFIDQLFRKKLASQTDALVTYSDYEKIFGQRTIQISNGVNFDALPPKKETCHNNELHLIGVAEVHYWHGYDRLIQGLGEYYQNPHEKKIYFHIVGGVGASEMYGSRHAPGFLELINKYNIEDYVIFHGQKTGKGLDELFNNADFAIGSLARHRTKIDKIKTLKNREYAARGIPFAYSETDEDFDHMPYVLKVPADETPININQIASFCEKVKDKPQKIRESILHLSWKEQMRKVIEQL